MTNARNAGRAAVVGGSIGGLFAAVALRRAGWEVRVFERVGVELAGRGAGIVTHDALIGALAGLGLSTEDLGVRVVDRVAIDRAGAEVERVAYPQIVTSWDRIHQLLRATMPEGTYLTGKVLFRYRDTGAAVHLEFEDGTTETADVLIGADGFRSAVRAQMLPEVQPVFSGYVVWRAVTGEAELPADVHASLFADFGFYVPYGTQILGYPIAGPGNDLRPGHRRYNFVWYVPVQPAMLQDLLTDETGVTHAVSIPPPRIRASVIAAMQARADADLPPAFAAIFRQCAQPFFTPIYDHCSTVFVAGRVALAGDAACVARPHVGMGVTKAALDALALARHLSGMPVDAALAAYSTERQPAALRAMTQGRRLGKLLHAGDATGNADGRSHPNLADILANTAVLIP